MTAVEVLLTKLDDAIATCRGQEDSLRNQSQLDPSHTASEAIRTAANLKRAERHGLETARRLVHRENDLQVAKS